MGQFDSAYGGAIYLVESVEDVDALQVRDPSNLGFVTQTTLSVDDTSQIIEGLRDKFPDISGPRNDDICYATQNRQDAVRALSDQCDLILVVGSANSSNSNRLKELAERNNTCAYLIDSAADIQVSWLQDRQTVGVTAGASAPESLVREVIDRLQGLGAGVHEEMKGKSEKMVFSLPRELRMPGSPGDK
jgi:4-hydroxy-3-methylbut-2-enyl diphosphate reductase